MIGRRGLPRLAASLLLVISTLAACSSAGGPILANAPVVRPAPAATPTSIPHPADPQPLAFPRDDGPHDRLTEWWYYTGHLVTAAGHRYGFEYVIFRAERGPLPVTWASHLALTDETGGTFHYAQRSEVGPQVDGSPRDGGGVPTGFALAIAPTDASGAPRAGPAWTMAGGGGRDHLAASFGPSEASSAGLPGGLALDLDLAATKPPALHRGIGWIDLGPGGSSYYYYSRTRLTASGSLTLAGRSVRVTGQAWFDHQWGDFIAVGAGGWDWFAVNLADGTDLTLSLVRDASGGYPLAYGTLVRPDGSTVALERSAFTVTAWGPWTSPHSGAIYPAGWTIGLPAEDLAIDLRPTVADQELDTRSTSGVVYWEGSQVVRATRAGRPLGGEAYVELTGYAPRVPVKQ